MASGWNSYVNDDKQLEGKVSMLSVPSNSSPQLDSNDLFDEGKNGSILPASKWAREDNECDDEEKRDTRDLGFTYSSSGSENAGDGIGKIEEMGLTTDTSNSTHLESGITEEQRQKLRRLEVALIEYRESLEERGIYNPDEIEKKVEIHRQRLQSEYGLVNFSRDVSRKRSRSTSERRDKREDHRETSRKRHRSRSGSESPQRKSSTRSGSESPHVSFIFGCLYNSFHKI